MSIIYLENLSNELFNEILDYLDGCDIYNAFSNLNYRFQQFLNSSCILFKIKFHFTSDELFITNYKQMRFLNKHQLLSLNLSSKLHVDSFFSSIIIDSSFDRLESIILQGIKRDTLAVFLKQLICLPRLFSLNIKSSDTSKDLCDVYQSIFVLPVLKYLQLDSYEWYSLVSLPIATNNQQLSKIKRFIIEHSTTFNELAALLSYTSELTHLKFFHLSENDLNVRIILPITLSNLTYISINVICVSFDEIEILIKKLPSKLEVFRFGTRCEDINYLNSNLWERLILQYLPNLKIFYFEYYKNTVYKENELLDYLGQPNHFISSFWFKRQWIFDVHIEIEEISFSIFPYKKRWYQSVNIDINSNSNILTMLTILYIPFDEYLNLLLEEIVWATTVASIYHLNFFPNAEIFIGVLLEIINVLPDLDSLKIWSLTLIQSTCLSLDDLENIYYVSRRNKITKVYLEMMIKFEEALFLIDVFPRMKYFRIGCSSIINIELFLSIILMKISTKSNHNLCLLAFSISTADDEMMKNLQKMIKSKKLIFNYTMTRLFDTIYLQLE